MKNIRTTNGYFLVELEKKDSSVVVAGREEETQKGKVIDISNFFYAKNGQKVNIENPDLLKGATVIFLKHSTRDTPKELEDEGLALIHYTSIMAVEDE